MTNAAQNGSASGPVRIGWAHGSITPDRPVQLHGQFHERISKFVQDPCTATAMAITSHPDEGEPDQAILISCDLVSIGRKQLDLLRRRVGERLPDFDPRKLLVNATHTHTGPTMIEGSYPPAAEGVMAPAEYATFFIECVSALAVQAWQARKPAGISSALGHAVLGFNRRTTYADGTSMMYGKSDDQRFIGMEGGMDPGLELLFTWDQKDRLTGVVINIACPSQVVENEFFISADFWHPTRDELRKRLGEQVHVYPMCSAAGDQSPRDLVRRNRGEPNMRKIEGRDELGRRLAMAVEDALHHAQTPRQRFVSFRHLTHDLSLPMRKATSEEARLARDEAARLTQASPDPASKDGRMLRRAQQTVERFESQGDNPRYIPDIHVMRLGDIAIATNPFELYLDYGLRMKARSPALQTFVVQLTNDRGAYLPTARAVERGSYGAMINDNLVGPEGGQVLVEGTLGMIDQLWPSQAEGTST